MIAVSALTEFPDGLGSLVFGADGDNVSEVNMDRSTAVEGEAVEEVLE